MTNDVTTAAPTELTLAADQRQFNEAQLAALEQMGVRDAPAGDLAVFFHQARRTGLDPFAKQIYMIGRWTRVKTKDESGRDRERYAMAYTIQVGIEGYRLIADRAARKQCDELEFDGPFWCGDDMVWHDAWPAKTPPNAAKFVVRKNGKPITAVCHYDEYVQTYNDRESGTAQPNSMWQKMPRNQLAKCAEAAALRRAYPNDFSGVHLEDAATVIDQDGNVERPAAQPPRRARGADALAEAAHAAQDAPQDAEVVEPDGTSGEAGTDGNWTPEARRKGLNRMHQLFGEADLPKDAREDRLIVTGAIVGREIGSSNDLTDAEIAAINHKLNLLSADRKLGQYITDVLNEAAIRQAQAEGASS